MELPFVEVRASKPAAKARFEAEAERQVAEELRQEIAGGCRGLGLGKLIKLMRSLVAFPWSHPTISRPILRKLPAI